MLQVKVPKSISLKAVFAHKDTSSVWLLQDCKCPASRGLYFPLSKSRRRMQK